MIDRKSLVSALWLTSALALLASVLVAPVQTLGLATASSRPDGFCLDFSPTPGQPTTFLTAALATDAVPGMNALPVEDEEQDRTDAWHEPRVSSLIPCSFRKVSDRQVIALRSTPSLYPLRC